MTKGRAAEPGTRYKAINGYWYTKQTTGRWKLDHIIVAEKKLGRPLESDERCRFQDGDRDNLSPDNIIVSNTRKRSVARKRAQLEARIAEAQAQLKELDDA